MKSVLPVKLVLPLVLGIIASLAIAVYAELGYRRLEVANKQMAVALEMQATLHETLALIVDAETGQRGYLLTGKEEYLAPYTSAVPKVDAVFSRLREALVRPRHCQPARRPGPAQHVSSARSWQSSRRPSLFIRRTARPRRRR